MTINNNSTTKTKQYYDNLAEQQGRSSGISLAQFTETSLKAFDLSDMVIRQMSELYMPLTVDGLKDKEGLKAVHEARIVVKNKRVAVEKTRKVLKEDALKYGKAVDEEARRITALLAPIETHLKDEEDKIKNLKAEIARKKKEEEEAKERARLQAIEDEIRARLDAEREEMERQRREEEERQAAIHAEQEAKQSRLEALARKLDEQQAKIEEEKLALEREKQPPTVTDYEIQLRPKTVGDIIDADFEDDPQEEPVVVDDREDQVQLRMIADQIESIYYPMWPTVQNERLRKTADYVKQSLQELTSIIREVIDMNPNEVYGSDGVK